MMPSFRNYGVIYSSFFIALILSIMPLPLFLTVFRPEWLLMMLLYWTLAMPHKIGSFHAFILGLILDLLLGSTIGMHAISLPVFSYAFAINFQQIRCFSIAKTTIIVGFIVFLNQLFLYVISLSQQEIVFHGYYFLGVFTSMLIWPWFFLFMRAIRLKFNVAEKL